MEKKINKTNDWKIKNKYYFDSEAQTRKINRKRSERYGCTDRDARITKYGMSNYLAHSDDLIA